MDAAPFVKYHNGYEPLDEPYGEGLAATVAIDELSLLTGHDVLQIHCITHEWFDEDNDAQFSMTTLWSVKHQDFSQDHGTLHAAVLDCYDILLVAATAPSG